jgi:PEP-CTERM motif-containing protein
MMRTITTTALAVALLLTLSAGVARAGPTYTITFGSFSGGTAQIHAPGTLANNLTVELGSVLISGALGTFESYCVDLNHYMNEHSTVTTALDTMANWNQASTQTSQNASGLASWLYMTFAAQAASTNNNVDRAALSLAIWNVLYDADYNVTTGTGFWVASSIYATRANAMLQALQAYQASGGLLPYANWLRTTDGPGNYTQDFITTVPEPGTLALVGIGLAFAAASKRRKKVAEGP